MSTKTVVLKDGYEFFINEVGKLREKHTDHERRLAALEQRTHTLAGPVGTATVPAGHNPWLGGAVDRLTASYAVNNDVTICANESKALLDVVADRDALIGELHEAYRRKDKSDTERAALQAQLDNANNELLQADDELAAARLQLAALATREPSEADVDAMRDHWLNGFTFRDWSRGLFRLCRDRLLADVPAPAAAPKCSCCMDLRTVQNGSPCPECRGYVEVPGPTPPVAPAPKCYRCNGVGRIWDDGHPIQPCPVCDARFSPTLAAWNAAHQAVACEHGRVPGDPLCLACSPPPVGVDFASDGKMHLHTMPVPPASKWCQRCSGGRIIIWPNGSVMPCDVCGVVS